MLPPGVYWMDARSRLQNRGKPWCRHSCRHSCSHQRMSRTWPAVRRGRMGRNSLQIVGSQLWNFMFHMQARSLSFVRAAKQIRL